MVETLKAQLSCAADKKAERHVNVSIPSRVWRSRACAARTSMATPADLALVDTKSFLQPAGGGSAPSGREGN